MTRFITVKRKFVWMSGLVLAVVFVSFLGFHYFFGGSEANTVPEKVEPEMKILSIEFEPRIVIRDLTYGGEVFKGVQTVPKVNYKVSAIVQNMTEKTMKDVPIQLTISLAQDKSKKISKEGKIPVLEPGATAKIAFENIKALGDAKGKDAKAGQHEMVLAISANPQGGITQNTEAKILFNVDSTVK